MTEEKNSSVQALIKRFEQPISETISNRPKIETGAQKWTCPVCAVENIITDRYCQACGELREDDKVEGKMTATEVMVKKLSKLEGGRKRKRLRTKRHTKKRKNKRTKKRVN
jgi:hypothetical protein